MQNEGEKFMIARKCDRCGKFYNHYDGMAKFSKSVQANAIVLIDKHLGGGSVERKAYDLCPECMEKIMNFLKNHFIMSVD